MNLAVVGSRTFTDRDMMFLILETWKTTHGEALRIVSGGAQGADIIAEGLSRCLDTPSIIFKPDWAKYGRGAGFIRNRQIVNASDALLAFYGPDGETKGTANSVRLALEKGIPVSIYYQRRER